MDLQTHFKAFLANYTDDEYLVLSTWKELERFYTQKHRYYHTLQHIAHVYSLLERQQHNITDWQVIRWSIFYHDIIYDANKKDNEERSAIKMKQVALSFGVNSGITERAYQQIIATKLHEISLDNDTNLLLDADLSILGYSWEEYEAYAKNIRKEYSIYPDFMYNMGRRKVLKHFLQMENIFKTSTFQADFEQNARKNLEMELNLL